MKLERYQKIARSYIGTEDLTEQVAFATMHVHGFSYDDVNNMSKPQFDYYSARMAKRMKKLASRPRYMFRLLHTNAEQITLGQFVEIQHWLKMGDVDSLPFIAASILRFKFLRKDHKRNVKLMLRTNARLIVHDVGKFMESFEALILSYKGLFEKDDVPLDLSEEELKQRQKEAALLEHPFIVQYGWQFTAKEIALYEGITLNEVYDLPIMQALNDMAYLKSQKSYLDEQNKS